MWFGFKSILRAKQFFLSAFDPFVIQTRKNFEISKRIKKIWGDFSPTNWKKKCFFVCCESASLWRNFRFFQMITWSLPSEFYFGGKVRFFCFGGKVRFFCLVGKSDFSIWWESSIFIFGGKVRFLFWWECPIFLFGGKVRFLFWWGKSDLKSGLFHRKTSDFRTKYSDCPCFIFEDIENLSVPGI